MDVLHAANISKAAQRWFVISLIVDFSFLASS
jgi:hypothetical protein